MPAGKGVACGTLDGPFRRIQLRPSDPGAVDTGGQLDHIVYKEPAHSIGDEPIAEDFVNCPKDDHTQDCRTDHREISDQHHE